MGDVPTLRCSRCGLSITPRFSAVEPTYCPRWVARAGALEPLVPLLPAIAEAQAAITAVDVEHDQRAVAD
jgi:hypothetical protein